MQVPGRAKAIRYRVRGAGRAKAIKDRVRGAGCALLMVKRCGEPAAPY